MRSAVTFLALTLCTCIFAQKDKSLNLNWHNKANENIKFRSSELQYSEKGKFYYNMSNDRDNMYIDLKIFDQDVQSEVLASGITVWINMDGKKLKKTGLRYPAKQGRPDMAEAKNMQRPSAFKIELIGLGGTYNSFISPDEVNNFRGSFRLEPDGNMWYELIIPLSKLPERSSKKGNDDSFILGISYAGIGSHRAGGGVGGPGAGAGNAMGGPGGGGSTGVPRGGGGGRGGRGDGGGMSGPGGGSDGEFGMQAPSASSVMVWFKNILFASER
jgi:hypothetical protein